MAITIEQQPPNGQLLAAYSLQPSFLIRIEINTGSPTRPTDDPLIVATIGINLIQVNIETFNASEYSYQGGNLHRYDFNINVAENCQSFFQDLDQVLLESYTIGVSSSVDYQGLLVVTFDEWLPDASGIPQPSGASVTSSGNYVIPAVINEDDRKDLIPYEPDFTPNAQWLTDKPQVLNVVCRSDHDQIAFWDAEYIPGSGQVGITYNAFNKLGIAIAVGSIVFPTLQNAISVIAGGPQNITDIPPGAWTILPTHFPDSPDVAYYELSISNNISTTYRFYTVDSCCVAYRLFFLNRFGVFDSFNVLTDINGYITESDSFERADQINYSNTLSRGVNRIQARGFDNWQSSTIRVQKEWVSWLKQLLLSPQVFIQTKDYQQAQIAGVPAFYYKPVVIQDGTFALINDVEGIVEFNFNFRASNAQIGQRN